MKFPLLRVSWLKGAEQITFGSVVSLAARERKSPRARERLSQVAKVEKQLN